MNAHAMTMDAAIDPLPKPGHRAPAEASARFAGRESFWVLSAIAAAPWPLFCIVFAFGVPGPHAARTPWSFWTDGPPEARLLHGPLAIALVLGAMAVWTHRPKGRALGRWWTTVLGMGVLGELVANALTDMGRSERALADLPTAARAVLVWVTLVALFELTPILASAAGMAKREQRLGVTSVALHAVFLGLAGLTAQFAPTMTSTGAVWFVSPWLVAALVIPLATARSGPPHTTRLPDVSGRAGPLFGLAALAWLMAAGFAVVEHEALTELPRALRFGADPRASVLFAAPAVACVAALVAVISLLRTGSLAERAPTGTVVDASDGGFTLERAGHEKPMWVALDAGPLPAVGAEVTLVGSRPAPRSSGPFRDGAGKWRARRAWTGPPQSLNGALRRRAAGWLAWAGCSFAGALIVARFVIA
ncbi:MAG: hypothetical protein AB8I08_26845 [Sandaracinaceae bacterium]